MSATPVGLHDLSIFVPPRSVGLADLAARRIAADPALEKHLARALSTTGQKAMRFPGATEDTVTLAAEAFRTLYQGQSNRDWKGLRFLSLGTETGVDMSKAGSSYVLGLMAQGGCPLPSSLATAQVQQACVGGTLALLTTAGFLAAAGRDDELSVVLTSDIARYKAPSTAEITQGAGATALLVGRHPDLLELDLAGTGFASHDVDDFFRPLGSTIAKVKGGYSLSCYHETLAEAFADHCRRVGVDPAEELRSCDAFYLHAPYASMPASGMEKLLAAHLGLDAAQAAEFLEARGFGASLVATAHIGNLYTGSLYLSLATGLVDRVKAWGPTTAGRKVLLASYGSGNTMAVFTARLAPKAAEVVGRWNLGPLMVPAAEAAFEDYLGWLDLVRTPENYPAIVAQQARGTGRFALTGLREDGYREYGIL